MMKSSQKLSSSLENSFEEATVVPTKSDSDVILCLQLLSKTQTCTLHLSIRESIDHLCINPPVERINTQVIYPF